MGIPWYVATYYPFYPESEAAEEDYPGHMANRQRLMAALCPPTGLTGPGLGYPISGGIGTVRPVLKDLVTASVNSIYATPS